MINKITPTGSLDQENDYPFIKNGDYRDALDVTSISDSRGNTLSWEPKTQQQYAFDLGEITVYKTAKWKVKFDGQTSLVYPGSNITFYRSGNVTDYNVVVLNDPSGTVMALDFYTQMSGYAGTVVSLDPIDPSIVYIQYKNGVPWDYDIRFDVGNITLTKIEDAIDASMLGPFVMCGGKELLGDLFIMSTTVTRMPEEFNVINVVQVLGLVQITLDRPHGVFPNELVFVNGMQPSAGIIPTDWIVSAISESNPGISGFDQITLALSTVVAFPVTFTGATVITRPRSLSQISVAVENTNSGTITCTSLLITNKFNFRTDNRIHLYCEEEGFRKSFYWCDGYNKDRCLYYTQDNYVTNGFLNYAGGSYELSDIELSGRLQVPQLKIDFIFKEVIQGTGSLLSGNYRYAIRFLNRYLSGTEWSDLGNIINISNYPIGSAYVFGNKDGTDTNSSTVFTVDGVPEIYRYYEVAYVRYSNNNYFAEAFRGDVTGTSFEITHTGRETLVPFVIDDLNAQNVFYETSHSIDALDNRLIRSNLTAVEVPDLSAFFKTIEHTIERTPLDSASRTVLGPWDGESYNEYRDFENVNRKKSFVPNETYRFSARVKLKDSITVSENFWIDDIIIDASAVNTGNVFGDNRRNGVTFASLEWTDDRRNPYVYYVNFNSIDWNTIVGGRVLRDIVERIYIDYVEITEEYKEVLASGIFIAAAKGRDGFPASTNGLEYIYGDDGSSVGGYGPFTSETEPANLSSKESRYLPAAANWTFNTNDYWVATSGLNWVLNAYEHLPGSIDFLTAPNDINFIPGQDYFITVNLSGIGGGPFVGTNIDIYALTGSTIRTFTHAFGLPFGSAGPYYVSFTSNGVETFSIRFSALADVQINSIYIYSNKLGNWFRDLEEYRTITSSWYNNKAGFFISPDIHFNQQNISFLSGSDQIIGQKQLVNKSFTKNDIGTPGINGGNVLQNIYNEWLFEDADLIPDQSNDLLGAKEILPYLSEQVYTEKLSNSTSLAFLDNNNNWVKNYYALPKCIGVVSDTSFMNGYIWDSGYMRCQYYRKKGKGAKYGDIESSKYVYSGYYMETDQPDIFVYGDVFAQNTFTKLRTPKDKSAGLGGNNMPSIWGWGLGVGMYSYNRGNYQMEYITDETIGAPPNISSVQWLESDEIYFTEYTNGYSNRFDIKNTFAYNPDVQVGNKFPTRILYSNVKPNGAFSDEYRTFLLLNFRDLNLSDGEIVHHENGNGELLTWQRNAFQRQYFNSSGLITASNDMDVVVGDGGALTRRGLQLSSIGTSHKWSISKGRSQGGNDIFAWVNTDLGEFVRFGGDGTVPIAQVKNMMSSLRDKIYWSADKYTPSTDLGLNSIWDDTNKCFHFVSRGARETDGLWQFYKVYNQPALGDLYVYAYPYLPSGAKNPVPKVFKLNVSTSFGSNPLSGSSDWLEVTDVEMFNIDFSSIKSGFQSYHTWTPKTMLKWNRTFVSARPEWSENKIYIHNRGGVQYSYPGIGQIATNPYITPVCVMDYNMKTTFDAVELNSSLLPARIDFTTEQHVSYLTTSEFEQDEIHDDLWAAPIKNDSTVDPVYNPLGVNDVDTSFLFGQYLLAKYSFDPTVKSKLFNFIIKLTPMSRLNNS